MDSYEFSSEDYDKAEDHSVLRLPNGEQVHFQAFMDRAQMAGETVLHASAFQPGDMVIFKPDEADPLASPTDFVVMTVDHTHWESLGLNDAPSVHSICSLQGTAVPEEFTDQPMHFVGSAVGLSNAELGGQVATHMEPRFTTVDGRQVLGFSNYRYAETFRLDEDGLQSLGPNELEATIRNESTRHTNHLERVRSLAGLFGYDITAEDQPDVMVALDRGQYMVEYRGGRSANHLTVLDPQTGLWMQALYYGSDKQILQVSVADLRERRLSSVFADEDYGISTAYQIRDVNPGITTYTTAPRYGLDMICYRPSAEVSRYQLGIPPASEHVPYTIPSPDLLISPDGTLRIGSTLSYDTMCENHPGLAEQVTSRISVTPNPDGPPTLHIGDKTVELPDPIPLLEHYTRVLH